MTGIPERILTDPSSQGVYGLLGALVSPRPIAWVSTKSATGVDNIAPHSFYQLVSTTPPIVMISSMGEKDTVRNIRHNGQFVVCGSAGQWVEIVDMVSRMIAQGENPDSTDHARDARPAEILNRAVSTTRYIEWLDREDRHSRT